MNEEFSDNRLAMFFQRWLNAHIHEYYLPNIRKCGTGIRKGQVDSQTVFVIQKEDHSLTRYDGIIRCHSAWACPKCTAEIMAKKATDIACAIDALKKQKQTAAMITFTIPHTRNMTCKEAFQVLLDTWRKFSRGGNRAAMVKKKYTLKTDKAGEKGTTKIYAKGIHPYGKFREDLEIVHNVRVFEFTWGENGWHPHIHALFWAPNKNFNKILDYEQSLLDYWWYCVKTETEKFWSKKLPPEKLKPFLEEVYADYKKITADGHQALYISKDKANPKKPRVTSSSWYIAGWGGDKEVTGNYKQKPTHSDKNFTPYQIISKAFESQGEEREKYLRLYAEYAQATFNHMRCVFSKSGLTQMIREYKKSTDYKETYTKKNSLKKWVVVYWFTKKQWCDILRLELVKGLYLRDDILEIAKFQFDIQTRRNLIKMLLEKYNIEMTLDFTRDGEKQVIERMCRILNKDAA